MHSDPEVNRVFELSVRLHIVMIISLFKYSYHFYLANLDLL